MLGTKSKWKTGFFPTTRRLYYWCCQIWEYQTREKVKGRAQRLRRRKRWCWSSWNFVGKLTPFTNHTLLNLDKDPYIGLFSLGTQEGEQPPPNFILWHESQCLHCILTVTSCGCFQRAHSLSCMFIIQLMAKWSAVTFAMHSGRNLLVCKYPRGTQININQSITETPDLKSVHTCPQNQTSPSR